MKHLLLLLTLLIVACITQPEEPITPVPSSISVEDPVDTTLVDTVKLDSGPAQFDTVLVNCDPLTDSVTVKIQEKFDSTYIDLSPGQLFQCPLYTDYTVTNRWERSECLAQITTSTGDFVSMSVIQIKSVSPTCEKRGNTYLSLECVEASLGCNGHECNTYHSRNYRTWEESCY